MPTGAAIWNAVALALGTLGLAMFIWAAFWDRSRGRLRCPRCWYDMKGVVETPRDGEAGITPKPSWTCPECGRVAESRRGLSRTRRRPWRSALGLAVAMLAAIVLFRGALAPVWPRFMPLTVLLMMRSSAVIPTEHIRDEIDRRMWGGDGVVVISRWPLLTRRQLRAAGLADVGSGSVYGLDPAGYPCFHLPDMPSYAAPEPVEIDGDPASLVRRSLAHDFDALDRARAGFVGRASLAFDGDNDPFTLRIAEPALDLDGDGQTDCLLLAEQPRLQTIAISLLHREGRWLYAGEFGVAHGRYGREESRIVSIGGHPFFLAHDDVVTGSGVYSGRILFHDLRDAAGTPAFAIPSRGHLSGWGQAIDHEWRVELRFAEDGHDVAFDADSRVEYIRSETADGEAIEPPPDVSWRVRYAWDDATDRFRAVSWAWTCEHPPRYEGLVPPMLGDSADPARFARFHAGRR